MALRVAQELNLTSEYVSYQVNSILTFAN